MSVIIHLRLIVLPIFQILSDGFSGVWGFSHLLTGHIHTMLTDGLLFCDFISRISGLYNDRVVGCNGIPHRYGYLFSSSVIAVALRSRLSVKEPYLF